MESCSQELFASSVPYGFHPALRFSTSLHLQSGTCQSLNELKSSQESSTPAAPSVLFLFQLPAAAFIQTFNFLDDGEFLVQEGVGTALRFFFDNNSQTSESLADEAAPTSFAIETVEPLVKNCGMVFNFTIPVSLRYHRATLSSDSKTTHASVEIFTPEIYISLPRIPDGPFPSSSSSSSSYNPTSSTSSSSFSQNIRLLSPYDHISFSDVNTSSLRIYETEYWKVSCGPQRSLTLLVPIGNARDNEFIKSTTLLVDIISFSILVIALLFLAWTRVQRQVRNEKKSF